MKPNTDGSTCAYRRGILTLLVTLATINSGVGVAANAPAGWSVHRSADYGFVIAYPPDFKSYSDLLEAQRSYIPVCQSESIACFEYNGNEYEGTNFEAAGVSVNILRELRTEKECYKIENVSLPIQKITLNGIPFHYGDIGEGGLGHGIGGPAYRTFREHVCFEVALLITATSISVYDPGTVKEFDSATLEKQLDRMLHTFRFVSHVLDGPGWNVHHNGGCGGVFEYPETATVVTAIEYTNERYYSDEITCEDYFMDQGSKYTVSVKVRLKSVDELEKWLKTYGYPDLGKATEEASSEYATEYKAGPYYYIYGQTKLSILSVSDAQHKVVSPDNNPVFRHFLSSFKAN